MDGHRGYALSALLALAVERSGAQIFSRGYVNELAFLRESVGLPSENMVLTVNNIEETL